jgi:cytochrome c1
MHFVKIGTRSVNLDNVAHVEEQSWHDCSTVKVHFVGQGNAAPLLLTEEEAKQLAAYLEYVAEQPLIAR